MCENNKIELIKAHVASYPDFPKQGVLFRDIFSVLREPTIAAVLYDVLCEKAKTVTPPVDCVAALDARGFLFGTIISRELRIPFVPVRKKGKLPGPTKSIDYKLEYREDELEIQDGCIKKGERVLIVDDLLATGGSLAAACQLITAVGGEVECLVVIELTELEGRKIISAPVCSIIKY